MKEMHYLLWTYTAKLWETREESGKEEPEYAQNTEWLSILQSYYRIYNYKDLGAQCFISLPLKSCIVTQEPVLTLIMSPVKITVIITFYYM